MIPFLIKQLTYSEQYTTDYYLADGTMPYKLLELYCSSLTHSDYYNRYYLYNCLVYGFNPRQEIFRINRRWKLFEHQIPKELK